MCNILIKICGLRDPDTARKAALAGADFIGINCHPLSKRFVDIDVAKTIAESVIQNNATPVAICVNHNLKEIREICEATHIRCVQLHGDIARSAHRLLPEDYQRIYVIDILNSEMANNSEKYLKYCHPKRDFVLYDSLQPGSGTSISLKKFPHQDNFRCLLAGGLTVKNVTHAIQKLRPAGVDVSSGVENSSCEKDLTLIKQFITHIKNEVSHVF
jgi:phosphoribosylanthranilate isomerase